MGTNGVQEVEFPGISCQECQATLSCPIANTSSVPLLFIAFTPWKRVKEEEEEEEREEQEREEQD
jgi:hypothetical protein